MSHSGQDQDSFPVWNSAWLGVNTKHTTKMVLVTENHPVSEMGHMKGVYEGGGGTGKEDERWGWGGSRAGVLAEGEGEAGER